MMFSKTIKYKDFNGEDQEKVFWFHLSNAKLAVLSADNNLKSWADRMIKSQDSVEILEKLRELIRMSCGVRSEDGQRFIQTPEAQSELLDSPAFDELLFELFVENNAVKFFSALVPPEQQKQIEELAKKQGLGAVSENTEEQPAWIRENRDPTKAELERMTPAQLQAAFLARASKQ